MSDHPGKEAGTAIAFCGLVLISLLLLGLVAMILPQALGVVAVIGLFGFMGAFHYILWGKWLSERVREETPEE